MKSMTRNNTVDSIRKIYPESNIVLQNDHFLLVQKEPTEKSYYVVPVEAEKDYESFARHSYRFLNFMHALGGLCRQYNETLKENNVSGKFIAAADGEDGRIQGFTAQLYFQKDDKDQKPYEKFLKALPDIERVR